MQRQGMHRIRIVILIATLALMCTTPSLADEKQEEEPNKKQDWVTKMIKLEHVDPNNVHALLRNLPVNLQNDPGLGVMIVHGAPSMVEFVEKTVRELDVPSKRPEAGNVEITAYLLGASRAAESGGNIIPILGGVVAELRRRFPYDGFRLLETTSLRLRPRSRDHGRISGLIPDLAVEGANPASYELSMQLSSIRATPGGHHISMRYVTLEARVPVQTSGGSVFTNIKVQTQMDMQAGKTVVVGKAGVQGVVDGIFLILQANVVD